MIEFCPCCRTTHEVGNDPTWKMCPDMPEGVIDIRPKSPAVIFLAPSEYKNLAFAETGEMLSKHFPDGMWVEFDSDGEVVEVRSDPW